MGAATPLYGNGGRYFKIMNYSSLEGHVRGVNKIYLLPEMGRLIKFIVRSITTMRTNKTLRIASVLLIAVLMTTCIIGGTFAKYTSSVNITSTAAGVAKWEVKASGQEETLNIDLTRTIKDVLKGDDALYTENDVVATKVAPGTKGSFTIGLANTSDVTASATITLDVSNVPTPIVFTATGATLSKSGNTITLTLGSNLAKTSGTADVTVNWVWAFEGNDTIDMGYANGSNSMEISGSVVFTQVD